MHNSHVYICLESSLINQNNNSNLSQSKEHITNIIHIEMTNNITLSNMKLGFEYMNLKAKFTVEAIKEIKNIEVKINIISNFYHSFTFTNIESYEVFNGRPTIYEKLKDASAKLGENITIAFHDYLSTLLDEINTYY
jgi:hypothetical protein